jgi:ATP-dependent Lon protease
MKFTQMGAVATVHRLFRAPDGTIRLLVQGVARIMVEEYTATEPYLMAKVSALPGSQRSVHRGRGLDAHMSIDQFTRYGRAGPQYSQRVTGLYSQCR